MTRPKLTKGPDRYTIQQLRKKAEEFGKQNQDITEWVCTDALLEGFIDYLEAQK